MWNASKKILAFVWRENPKAHITVTSATFLFGPFCFLLYSTVLCLLLMQLATIGVRMTTNCRFSRQSVSLHLENWVYIILAIITFTYIGTMIRVFANDLGDLGSIPGRVIPKTLKMVLDTSLLNTQQYKVLSRVKWSNPGKGVAPSPTPRCSSYWKGSLRVALDQDPQLYLQCYKETFEIHCWKLNAP